MKLVIKIGSSSLTNQTKVLSRPHMAEFARQISMLHNLGHEIVFVCSGSIVAGREVLKTEENSIPPKQMLASIGQVRLMHLWTELFQIYGITIGQILLSKNDFAHPSMSHNAQNTFAQMFLHRILPIVNENDTVAIDEIIPFAGNKPPFGENDALAAHVAVLVGAELLFLLTDQHGLYTHDPRSDPQAKQIDSIEKIDEAMVQFSIGGSGAIGTGGMATKIAAARSATEQGIDVIIAHAYETNILARLLNGDKLGTRFVSQKKGTPSKKGCTLFAKNNHPREKFSS